MDFIDFASEDVRKHHRAAHPFRLPADAARGGFVQAAAKGAGDVFGLAQAKTLRLDHCAGELPLVPASA